MKYFDIQKVFSQIVAEKLNEHCVLFTEHMSGSQGEIAKIDYIDLATRLSHPNHMYRILLENEHEYLDKEFSIARIETVVLSIRYYDEVRSNHTVWNKEGKVVFKKTYYKLDKDFYTDSRQEAEDAVNLKLSRRKVRDYDEDIVLPVNEVKFNTVATDYVKRKVYRFAKEVVAKKMSKGRYFVSYKKKNGDNAVITLYLEKQQSKS